MAAIDALTRSNDVIAKYRKRMDDWSAVDAPKSPDEFDAIVAELRDDIVNAINAAVNEVQLAAADAKAKADAKAAPEHEPKSRPATTHMPATGSHASARK